MSICLAMFQFCQLPWQMGDFVFCPSCNMQATWLSMLCTLVCRHVCHTYEAP